LKKLQSSWQEEWTFQLQSKKWIQAPFDPVYNDAIDDDDDEEGAKTPLVLEFSLPCRLAHS
jgi:hypothetical protein